ncbi:MAG: ParB/RepB/Spo0J family partition protein [Pyrinomonadaceae bacterium]
MSKRGLPSGVKMRHDSHYVEEFVKTPSRTVGRIIPINQIEPNPDQPRVEIGDLTELSSSIKQKGVLEPLLVKPNGDGTWMIIAGERRWRASNLAGLREVPCIELDIDEKSIAEIALIENLQRKDLNVWEEADALAALSSRYGYTHEEIARKIGKSRTTVTESFAIAGLPHAIREKCRQADINAKSTLLEIARQFDEQAMHDFLVNIKQQGIKREDVRQNARKNKGLKDKILPENKVSSVKEVISDKIFKYISKEKGFSLEIHFTRSEYYERRDVLQALKEAFDKTKHNDDK